jgi:tetratricopeptide (TPR) repeat protein
MNASNTVDTSRAPRPWLIGLLVAVLTLVAYIPAFEAPFIYDDYQLILDSPRVKELKPLREYWGSSFWTRGDIEPRGRSYYRPLTIFSLALDYRLHGKNASGFHIANALLHAANAVLIFALLRRRRLDAPQAALLALAWAWFPRLTEAAAWISGRTDVLAAFFVFLALLLSGRERAWTRWAAACAVLLGLFAKEVAAAGLVAVAVTEWFSRRDLPLHQRATRLIPVVCSGAAYTLARLVAMGIGVQSNGLTPRGKATIALEALGRYAVMLVDAWHPDIQIGYLGAISWPHVALGAACLVAACIWFWRRGRFLDADALAGLAMLVVSIGLVLHVIPISVNIVAADRFMYVPLAGLVLLLAPLAKRPLRHPAFAALALVSATFAVTTFPHARLWADEVDFWTQQFRTKKKFNATSRLELGNVYARAGLRTYALGLYMNADKDDYYNYLLSMHNAAIRFTLDGRYAEARAIADFIVARGPEVPKFQYTLALLCMAEHKLDEAEKHLDKMEKLNPDSESARRLRESIRTLREAEKEPPPDDSTLHGKLAHAMRLALENRPRDSVEMLLKASESPEITQRQLTEALLYTFDWGTPKQLTALYERYRAIGGRSPVLAENYRLRMERVARLKALWPTLARDAPPPSKHLDPSAMKQ